MAADIGIKIDAVFSLVGPDHIEDDLDRGNREEDIVVDIGVPKYSQYDLQPELTMGEASGTETQDESTDSASSTEKYQGEGVPSHMYVDFDAPPPLFMESSGPPTFENQMLAPPVLEPEEPIVAEPPRLHADLRPIPRKRCIAPSYIVLTNVQPFMKGKHKVSHRQLKRKFKECLNICKKVHFARQLNRGKDVFNVKVGNKATCNSSVLKVKSSPCDDSKSFVGWVPGRGSTDKSKTRNGSKGRLSKIDRVRRKISKFPKDFDQRFMNTLNSESLLTHAACDSDELSDSELKERDAIRRQVEESMRHNRELENLKKQTTFKRKMNKRAKSLRKVMTKANQSTPFYCKATTSNFSGRARKPNKKYSQEGFAMTNDEINYFRAEHKQKDILKKEMRLFEERVKKDTRKLAQETCAQKRPVIDLVIDNPEESEVHTFSVPKSKPSQQESRSEKAISRRAKRSKKKCGPSENRNRSLRDSVLIRDLPSDDHVIRGMLMSSTLDNIDSNTVSREVPESRDIVETHQNSENGQLTKDALLKDKFEKLKIPKSVQRLFHNKQHCEELVSPKTTTPSANIGAGSGKVTQSVNASNASLIHNNNTNIKSLLIGKLSGSDNMLLKQGRSYTEVRPDVSVKQTSTIGLNDLTLVKTIDGDGSPIFKAFNSKGCVSFKPKDSATSTQAPPVTKPPAVVVMPPQMTTMATQTSGAIPVVSRPSLQNPGGSCPKVVMPNGQHVLQNPAPKVSLLPNARHVAPANAHSQQVANVVNLINNAQGQIRSHTVPIIRARPPAPVTEAKSKFYLLNVDGKNILVPINPNPSEPPRAYLIGNSLNGTPLASANVTPQQPNVSLLSNISTASAPVPTLSQNDVSNMITHTFTQARAMTSIVRSNVGITTGNATILSAAIAPIAPKVNQTPVPGHASSLTQIVSTVPMCSASSSTATNMKDSSKVIGVSATENVSKPPSNFNNKYIAAVVKTEKIDEEFDKIENRGKVIHKDSSKDAKTTNVTPDTSVSFTANGSDDKQSTKPKEASGESDPPKAFADALSAREERRRRLKELIKEKNEALEAIRASSNKT